MELSIGRLEGPHDMAAGLPQSGWSTKERDRSCYVFYDLALGVTLCLMFLQYSVGSIGQLIQRGRSSIWM